MAAISRNQKRRKKLAERERRRPRIQLGRQAETLMPLFTAQRPFIPMAPLVRWSERCDEYHLPNGTVVSTHVALWKNDIYAVAVDDPMFDDGITHVTVQRLDETPARDWRHLQQIKNETCGSEREAVELFPAQSRAFDTTNTTHLFVFGEGVQLPIGDRQPTADNSDLADRLSSSPSLFLAATSIHTRKEQP